MAPLIYVQHALLLWVATASAFTRRTLGPRSPMAINGTSISSTALRSSSPTTSIDTSTITPSPTAYESYSLPYCSRPDSITTEYCRVSVGTVQLHYWPTGPVTLNHTYPSTMVLSDYGVTMTSPSIYYVINEMKATDYCGNLIGPIITNFITSYNLDQVSTLPPFANAGDDSRIGGPTQLQLSDLKTDCPQTYSVPVNNHNTVGDEDYDPGCNPVIDYTVELKDSVAGGAWAWCGRYWGGKLGIFDPPSPVTPCGLENCGDAGAGSSTTAPPVGIPTSAIPEHTPTSDSPLPPPASPPSSASAPPSNTAPPQAPTPTPTPGPVPSPSPPEQQSPPPEEQPTPDLTSEQQPAPADPSPGTPASEQPAPANPTPADPNPAQPSTEQLSPEQPNPAQPSPKPPAEQQPQPTTTDPNQPAGTPVDSIPTAPIPIATIPIVITPNSAGIPTTIPGSNVISAVPGQSHVVIGGKTISQGGPPVTIPGAGIVSVAPSAVVISNPENGAVTTYTIPPLQHPAPTPANQNLGVIDGQTISGIAIDSSQAVAGGQTLTIGGPVATLAGNQVVSLATEGLVVQGQAGIVTTLIVPTQTLPPPISGQPQPQPSPTGADDIAIPSDGAPGAIIPLSDVKTSPILGSPPTTGILIPTDTSATDSDSPSSLANPVSDSSLNTDPTGGGNIGPTAATTPVTTTGLGGVIYNTFQGDGSRVTRFDWCGSMLSLVLALLYTLS